MSALSSLTCGEEPSLTILVLFTFHFLTRYVMICTNDLLIIIGSIIKQLIESKSIVGDMWDVCSLMLGENIQHPQNQDLVKITRKPGTGNLLVWFGLLRYLGFFKTYNVLILTMKVTNMSHSQNCSN